MNKQRGMQRLMRPRITIDCSNVGSEEEFWRLYLDSVDAQDSHLFGRNLHAFWDALDGGGPGWPGDVDLHFTNAKSLAPLLGGTFLTILKRQASNLSSARVTFD